MFFLQVRMQLPRMLSGLKNDQRGHKLRDEADDVKCGTYSAIWKSTGSELRIEDNKRYHHHHTCLLEPEIYNITHEFNSLV